jgi:hypothetical protein
VPAEVTPHAASQILHFSIGLQKPLMSTVMPIRFENVGLELSPRSLQTAWPRSCS